MHLVAARQARSEPLSPPQVLVRLVAVEPGQAPSEVVPPPLVNPVALVLSLDNLQRAVRIPLVPRVYSDKSLQLPQVHLGARQPVVRQVHPPMPPLHL